MLIMLTAFPVDATDITIGDAAAITKIDSALDAVASHRALLGAQQAQLESTVRNWLMLQKTLQPPLVGSWIPTMQLRRRI